MKLFKLKRKNIILVSLLAIAGFLGISSVAVNTATSKETPVAEKAEAGNDSTYKYIVGSFTGWDTKSGLLEMSVVTNYNYYSRDFTSGEKFKIIKYGSWDGAKGYSALNNLSSGNFSGDGDGNICCNTTAKFDIILDSGTVRIVDGGKADSTGYQGWVIAGEGSTTFGTPSWSPSTAIHMDSDGTTNKAKKLNLQMKTSDQMRICYSDGYQLRDWKAWVSYSGDITKPYDNLVIGSDGYVDVYLNNSYEGSASHAPGRTITYNYKSTDNGTVKTSTSETAKQGSSVTLPNSSATGFNFYGWYESYSSGVFSDFVANGGASYTVPTANKILYGRYVANGYGYLLLSTNNWNPTSSYRMTDNSPQSGYRKITHTFGVNDEFYVFYCNSSGSASDENYHWSDVDAAGDATLCFTASGDNIKCTTAGTYDIILNTSTGKLYIYHNPYETSSGYYMAGTGSFGGNWSITSAIALSADPSGNNTAILENGVVGTYIENGSRFKVVNHSGIGSNTWYSMTRGETYDYAYEYVEEDKSKSITFTESGYYNFYFKIDNGTNYIYIVDVSTIAKSGTLYLSSPQGTIGSITVTTTNTKSEHQFENAPLAGTGGVSGTKKESNTLKFNGGYIYSIPIYNLRGNDSASACTSVTFSWTAPSSGSVTVTSVDSLGGDSEHYFITSGGTASEDLYVSLALALDFDDKISGASNKSVCNILKSDAEDLCDTFDDLSSDQQTTFLNSTISTYTSTKPTYTGNADIPMRSILYQVSKIAADGVSRGSLSIFGGLSLFGGEDSFSTIIIIISSSVALLSVTALSILVIRKRKSKED